MSIKNEDLFAKRGIIKIVYKSGKVRCSGFVLTKGCNNELYVGFTKTHMSTPILVRDEFNVRQYDCIDLVNTALDIAMEKYRVKASEEADRQIVAEEIISEESI